jgi:hypothetical protein
VIVQVAAGTQLEQWRISFHVTAISFSQIHLVYQYYLISRFQDRHASWEGARLYSSCSSGAQQRATYVWSGLGGCQAQPGPAHPKASEQNCWGAFGSSSRGLHPQLQSPFPSSSSPPLSNCIGFDSPQSPPPQAR